MPSDHLDPRVLRAYQLLREVVEEGPVPGRGGGAFARQLLDGLLYSTTDLLVPWSPLAPGAPGETDLLPDTAGPEERAAWDRYFAPGEAPAAPVAEPLAVELPFDSLAEEPGDLPWEELDEAVAEAAVDRLYEFVHALGRRDVEAAMASVAGDFHAMEGDREVDRQGLRHKLESFLDERQKGDLEVSLARVPEPVHHPAGVLVEIALQADFTPWGEGERKRSDVIRAVAVLGEQPDGRWLLAGLGWLEP